MTHWMRIQVCELIWTEQNEPFLALQLNETDFWPVDQLNVWVKNYYKDRLNNNLHECFVVTNYETLFYQFFFLHWDVNQFIGNIAICFFS